MDDLNIAGTVSFKSECKDRWQTVYSSSLYGTMFSIFGKFDYDSNTKTLKNIILKLINYKGLINLGIQSAEFTPSRKWVKIDDINMVEKIIRIISLKVTLRGLISNTDELEINEVYTLNECDLKNSVYLEIDRVLVKLSGCDGEHTENYVFDSEFYFRDGLREPEILDTTYRQARDLNPCVNARCEIIDGIGRITVEDKENKNNSAIKSPGAVCPKGYSKIIF